MERKKNLQTDYFIGPLMEMFIIHHQQIMQEFNLLHQHLNKIESQVGSTRPIKSKEKDFYTTEEVMVMLSISRRTLFSLRETGKIGFTKSRNMVRFTKENIEEFKRASSR
jgi:excisionase family DNA binding protein